MTKYDDYLQYLKHVDDETLLSFKKEIKDLNDNIVAQKEQSKQQLSTQKTEYESKISDLKKQFKEKEEVLNKTITETKRNCEKEIMSIQDDCKKKIDSQKADYETKIADLKKESKNIEGALNQSIDEAKENYEEEIKMLRTKLSTEKARYTKDMKKSSAEVESQRNDIEEWRQKADMYENMYAETKSKIKELSNIRITFVIMVTLCTAFMFIFVYLIYILSNKDKHYSLWRWMRCDKYSDALIVKEG